MKKVSSGRRRATSRVPSPRPTTMTATRSYTILAVGLVGIVVLGFAYSVVMVGLGRGAGAANGVKLLGVGGVNDAAGSVGVSGSDPLVTVVPPELRGGYPRPLETDPQKGAGVDETAITIIEFGDFTCTTSECSALPKILNDLLAAYPTNLRVVWKDFPIPAQHPQSAAAATAARCGQEQAAFWSYHNALMVLEGNFNNETWLNVANELGLDASKFAQCLESAMATKLITQGYFTARALELTQAPAIFVNDLQVTGELTYENIQKTIEAELASLSENSVPTGADTNGIVVGE